MLASGWTSTAAADKVFVAIFPFRNSHKNDTKLVVIFLFSSSDALLLNCFIVKSELKMEIIIFF